MKLKIEGGTEGAKEMIETRIWNIAGEVRLPMRLACGTVGLGAGFC